MGITLGIDTGGTFTDLVFWDTCKNKVLQKSKSFTTHNDLAIGINNCIEKLNANDFGKINAVNLSTTLTVNSILEDKSIQLGAVLIGRHITKELPVGAKYEVVRYNYRPVQQNFIVNNNILQDMSQLIFENYPAIIISADGENRCSIEKAAAISFSKVYTGEIFCCSDYADDQDFYERTLKATIIIRLQPILKSWIDSITKILRAHSIEAPIKMLTNQGDMIPLEQVLSKPLDIIMSSPVAAYISSNRLVTEKDYLLIDMGGTSMDITKVNNRKARFSTQDTSIGKYSFHMNTLDMQSYATGGDSKIKLNHMGDLVVGPQKVTPLCVLGSKYPHLKDELEKYSLPDGYDLCTADENDCYYINDVSIMTMLKKEEKDIINILANGPHSLLFLADMLEKDPDALHMDRLLEKGYVHCASLTPTDVLHAEGTYLCWDEFISKVAINNLAKKKNMDSCLFIQEVKSFIIKQLTFFCMQSIARFEKKQFQFSNSKATMYLIEKFLNDNKGLIESNFLIQKPIIGVGAPAAAWLPAVATKLNTNIIIPDNAEVACAIGSAAGKVK